MIKQLAALALTGFVSLGCASSAVAHKIPLQPFDLEGTNFLLRTVRNTGHRTFSSSTICDKNPDVFGFVLTSNKALVVCRDNIESNVELADTVRHEAFHLAQFCKAKKVGATNALIFPDWAKEVTRLAQALGMPFEKYPKAQQLYEAEARAAAFIYTDKEIAHILAEQCS